MIIELDDGRKIEIENGATQADIDSIVGSLAAPKLEDQETTPKWKSALYGGATGASFGLTDELTAKAVQGLGMLDGKDISYDDALKASRAEFDKARKDNPTTYMASEIAGSLAPAAKIGGLAAKGAEALGAGAVAQGAAAGALPGAVYGAGSADNDRLGGAALGGVTGGMLGAAIPAVGKAITAMRNKPFDDAATQQAQNILEGLGLGGNKSLRKAAQQIIRAKNADLGEADINLAKPLFEQGGEATKSAAMAAGRQGGEAAKIMGAYTDNILAPEITAGKASNILEDYLSDPGYDLTEKLAQYARSVRDAAKPAYREAYESVPVIDYKKVSGLLDRLDPSELSSVMDYAGKMARREGRTLGLKDEGGAIKNLSSEAIDYISRTLRDPAAFGDKPLGKGLISFNNEISSGLRDVLRAENPKWANVVGKYSDAIGLQNAMEAGRAFSPTGGAKKISDAVAQFGKLNDAEQQAFRAGVAENLFGTIDKNPNAFLRMTRSPQFKDVMSRIMPSDMVDEIVSRAGAEHELVSRANAVSRNSITSNAQAAIANEAGEGALADLADAAARGNTMHLIKQMVGSAARKGIDRVSGVTPESRTMVAKALTTAPRDFGTDKESIALLKALTSPKEGKVKLPPNVLEKLLARRELSSVSIPSVAAAGGN